MLDHQSLTIVIAMLPETGHLTGTFRLSRALQSRGHRVVYFGLADFEKVIKDQGFEFVIFAADILPFGYTQQFYPPIEKLAPRFQASWRRRREDERLFVDFLKFIVDGRLDASLLACQPDLLICDTLMWYVTLRALYLKVPTIPLSICLTLYPNACIPPITSSMRPSRHWCNGLAVSVAWKWMRLKYFFSKRLSSILFGWYRFPTRVHHLVNIFHWVAKRSDYPCRENETYWYGETGPRLILPEIVLVPEAFQLPNTMVDERRYLGECIDLERKEAPIDEAVVMDNKPLILCSLGTASIHYPHREQFFKAVVEASVLRQDWQFVLHVDNQFDVGKSEPVNSNLHICKWMPQLTLLERASVMVTHGGINSIMECIHFEVPMVIVPGLRDQPGNAVRAAHHGIAVVTDMATITPRKFESLVGSLMNDTAIRKALAAIKQTIASQNDIENIMDFMESFASR